MLSFPTDAVGHNSAARQAARVSSSLTGCRAKTDLPARRTISPGATSRDAAQSIQRLSIYQSPGADSGLRSSRLGIVDFPENRFSVEVVLQTHGVLAGWIHTDWIVGSNNVATIMGRLVVRCRAMQPPLPPSILFSH